MRMNRPPALLMLLALLAVLSAAPASASADATIAAVQGPATLVVGGKHAPATERAALPPGGKVMTAAGGTVLILLADGSKIRVGENSVFSFDNESAADTNLRLLKGFLTAWVRHLGNRRLNVRTASAVASVRGTVFSVKVADGRSAIALFQGSVWVTDRFGRSTVLTEGQRVVARYDQGLQRAAVLPPGARAPEEPSANGAPPAASAQPGPKTPAGQTPPSEMPSQPGQTQSPTTAPPPPPTQQTTVVSPSAP